MQCMFVTVSQLVMQPAQYQPMAPTGICWTPTPGSQPVVTKLMAACGQVGWHNVSWWYKHSRQALTPAQQHVKNKINSTWLQHLLILNWHQTWLHSAMSATTPCLWLVILQWDLDLMATAWWHLLPTTTDLAWSQKMATQLPATMLACSILHAVPQT